MEVFDVDLGAGIDGQAGSTFFVSTELKLAGSNILAQCSFRVLEGVIRQIIARPSGKEVAFACTLSVTSSKQGSKSRD